MTENQNTPSYVMRCRHLTVGHGGRAVLNDLDLNFAVGHFVSLLGPNGAGKTTLLRTLSRHLPALGGEILIQGKALASFGAADLARIMAVVLTEKVTPPLFKVHEFVALGRYPHTDFLGRLSENDHKAVDNALEAVHATDLAGRIFTDLSDGERQKVLVARALAQEPKILLLDEPTVHLDLKHRIEVMGILRDLCRQRNITVVASLHDVDVAAKVSDRVLLVKNGRRINWGAPEAVLTRQTVSGLYDFAGAEFSSRLGSIELRGDGRGGPVFVVAGMGSGAQMYRLLTKRGYRIKTGLLHTNDIDYFVARSLGAECHVLAPGEAVSGALLEAAQKSMDACNLVIDCGFPETPVNRENTRLVEAALGRQPVFSLRPPAADTARTPQWTGCEDAARLLDAIDRYRRDIAPGGRAVA